ncbi:MAG: cyclomaltodextrinase N-terminal domain-containing protein, partial [Bacteroidota bacterium]|nr:cyclomaltodextrinase N-terminal domain-containing protein [Bacteroidota bacterium]
MKRFVLLFTLWILTLGCLRSQNIPSIHVEPPYWWTGFKNTELELMLKGDNISSADPVLSYNGITIEKVSRTENPDYLFIDLKLSPETKPGTFEIQLVKYGKIIASNTYTLRQRKTGSSGRKGFDASDVIYLITPDRFSNGDTANDNLTDMIEKVNRTDKDGRHGGDIKGILNHLDYIRN